MPRSAFTIGELARCAGINPKTIRYYEEIGLLPQPLRNEAGYRLYSERDLARLRFIQRVKLLGLSLAEVRHLAGYADNRQCHSLQEHLLGLVEDKLVEVDRRIAELAALRDDLKQIRDELTSRVKETSAEQITIPNDVLCQCLAQHREELYVN